MNQHGMRVLPRSESPWGGYAAKPHLPDLGPRRLLFLKLTPMVRLGMQIAFGRVRRKTAPTGVWVKSADINF